MIKTTQNLQGHVISSCKPTESAVGTTKTEQRSQVLRESAPCSELRPPRMHPPIRGRDFSHAGRHRSFPSYSLSHLCCFLTSSTAQVVLEQAGEHRTDTDFLFPLSHVIFHLDQYRGAVHPSSPERLFCHRWGACAGLKISDGAEGGRR